MPPLPGQRRCPRCRWLSSCAVTDLRTNPGMEVPVLGAASGTRRAACRTPFHTRHQRRGGRAGTRQHEGSRHGQDKRHDRHRTAVVSATLPAARSPASPAVSLTRVLGLLPICAPLPLNRTNICPLPAEESSPWRPPRTSSVSGVRPDTGSWARALGLLQDDHWHPRHGVHVSARCGALSLRSAFGWDCVDAHDGADGWLIFRLPSAKLGVDPADAPVHEISFLCDDVGAGMAELAP